jgi:hypothetical protein
MRREEISAFVGEVNLETRDYLLPCSLRRQYFVIDDALELVAKERLFPFEVSSTFNNNINLTKRVCKQCLIHLML